MTMAAEMIITRGGAFLPLDQRRRDALMTYAQHSADAAGVPRQTWARTIWKLQDYEAKDLLRGNASETVWERILKLKGPHCGWQVALPILGAVIGQPVHEFFQEQMRQAAKEAARAEQDGHLAEAAWRTLAVDAADARAARKAGTAAGTVGPDAAGGLASDRLTASNRRAR